MCVIQHGTVAKLTDTAASALNWAFKTQAIKAGPPLGVVRLVAKGTVTTYEGIPLGVVTLTAAQAEAPKA